MMNAQMEGGGDDQLGGSKPPSESPAPAPTPPPEPLEPLEVAVPARNAAAMAKHFAPSLRALLNQHAKIASAYMVVALMDSSTLIGDYELDRIYRGLRKRNGEKQRDVLLCLLSSGGSIEPAYRISKVCRAYSANKFVVCVPRYAKSAATLISLGADEIHFGALGQLGPIDPQFGGMPALAVPRALSTLAELVEKYPGSSQMLSNYLTSKLKLEQVGYYQRVVESAVQYAERLLKGTGKKLARTPAEIATTLVHEYKDHGFVIDYDEASQLLGKDLVRTGSPEALFSEDLYSLFFWWQIQVKECGHGFALYGSLHAEDLDDAIFVWPNK
jgi:hypothetical protein